MSHIHKILVPCDGSPPSIAALNEALALATDLGASVDLLEVHPLETRPMTMPLDASEANVLDDVFAAAKQMFGDRISRRDATGEPARTILETASEGYDVIVMGTHGRIGRLRATLGSVAETVVRSASIPVLTVRASTGAEESFAERIHHHQSIAEQVRR